MARSLGGGIIAIVMSLAVYFALVSTMSSSFIAHTVWFVPMIGAAVAAFIAPRHKFNVGAATFVPAALLMGAAAYVAGRFGAGDFVGAQGTAIGVVLSLPFIIGASAVGALLGEWASKI
jgi:hypothetical protein